MLINRIINVDEDYDSGDVTEPVTVQEFKDYARVEGFNSDESGEQEFDFDDTLIKETINEGRVWLEQFTKQFVVTRLLTVVLSNQAGGQKLPGPVIGSVVYKNHSGDVITDKLTVYGTAWPKISCSWSDNITATYEAGYDVMPNWVKKAVLAYVLWSLEHRGDEEGIQTNPGRAESIARPHKKGPLWG